MIRITIDGTVGVQVNGTMRAMTSADGAFEADKTVEAMLINDGCAVYVDKNGNTTAKKSTKSKSKTTKKQAKATDDGETPPNTGEATADDGETATDDGETPPEIDAAGVVE